LQQRFSWPAALIALAIGAFLITFLILPVLTVVKAAFTTPQGGFTLTHFVGFFQLSLMRESFANSLYVAGMTVLLSTLIAVPLAYFTVRFHFRGGILIQTLGVLPLIMPAFVGASACNCCLAARGRSI
jgi:iron(III) transport system permease protein